MTTGIWLTATVSLLVAVIGGSFAIGAVLLQLRHHAREVDRQSERGAVHELIACSADVVLRADQLAVVAPALGSVSGTVGRFVGLLAPADLGTLTEPLIAAAARLEHCAARVRVHCDQSTVDEAEKVVKAALRVVGAYNRRRGRAGRWVLMLTLRGKRAYDVREAVEATAELERQRAGLIEHVRRRTAT